MENSVDIIRPKEQFHVKFDWLFNQKTSLRSWGVTIGFSKAQVCLKSDHLRGNSFSFLEHFFIYFLAFTLIWYSKLIDCIVPFERSPWGVTRSITINFVLNLKNLLITTQNLNLGVLLDKFRQGSMLCYRKEIFIDY